MTVWHKLMFGKHIEKTLPEVIFYDPDYFFWGLENDVFYGRFGPQASLLAQRASNIVLRNRKPGTYVFEWFWGPDGRFARVEIVKPDQPRHVGSSQTRRTDRLDLSVLRDTNAYDKGGYKRLMRQVRPLLFGKDTLRLSRGRCDAFFNDDANFGR
jgi:hypothetical protein